jgi:hypothetical protein
MRVSKATMNRVFDLLRVFVFELSLPLFRIPSRSKRSWSVSSISFIRQNQKVISYMYSSFSDSDSKIRPLL